MRSQRVLFIVSTSVLVTTSKTLVTRSDALVPNSFLLLPKEMASKLAMAPNLSMAGTKGSI